MQNPYDYYGIYRSCRDAAWRCLWDFGIDRLPVSVMSAARQMGVHVMRNSESPMKLRSDEIGAAIHNGYHWHVIYDDRLPAEEARFVLAHELGHILMGHEYKYAEARFDGSRKIKCEREADMFAMRVLAPAFALHELQALDADRIAALCRIPKSAAKSRALRMAELEKRGKYYTSELEQKLRDRFEPYLARERASQSRAVPPQSPQ
ncbi:MAG: ImmA/IrrE family metallo-endopeptidase [Clostridia bacterium]|nr:ImmA/IrrE family metallo-endopeptidase [Clostridia bacterium]